MQIPKAAPIFIGGFVLLLFTTILFAPPIHPTSPLVNEAHPSRLAETHMLSEQAIARQGWVSGWDQRFLCGYPIGIYQYQTGPTLIAALSTLTGLPVHVAYRIILFLGSLFAVCMVWLFLLRWVSGGVALAATLAMFVGAGVIGQMAQGFWNCVMSLGLLALFLDQLNREGRLDARRSAKLILIYALIIPTHQYTAIAAGFFMLGRLPAFLRKGGLKALLWWAAIPLAAILLTLHYVVPILETRHWMIAAEDTSSISASDLQFAFFNLTNLTFLKHLFTGQGAGATLKSLATDWPNLAAWALTLSLLPLWRAGHLKDRDKRLASGLLIALALFVILNFKLIALIPIERIRETAGQIVSYRFKIYSDLCLFILAALALHHWNILYRNAPALSLCKLRKRLPPKALSLALAILLTLTCGLAWYRMSSNNRYDTFEDLTSTQQGNILAVWDWLKGHDRGDCRVLYETTYQNFPAGENGETRNLRESTLMALGALHSGMPQAGGLYNVIIPMHHYTWTANRRLMGLRLEDVDPAVVLKRMKACNIGYVVACSPDFEAILATLPGLQVQERFGPFAIYRYRDTPGRWAEASGGENVDFQFDPENDARMHASFTNTTPGNRLGIRVGWHPYWRAHSQGTPVQLRADSEGMIEALIDKTGPVEVEFLFSSRKPLALIIQSLAWLGLIAAMALSRTRRRHTSP